MSTSLTSLSTSDSDSIAKDELPLCVSCQLVPGLDSDQLTFNFVRTCSCKFPCCLECSRRLTACVYCRNRKDTAEPAVQAYHIIRIQIDEASIYETPPLPCTISLLAKQIMYIVWNISYMGFILATCWLYGFKSRWIILLLRACLGFIYGIYILFKPVVSGIRNCFLLTSIIGVIWVLCMIGVETDASFYNIIYIFTELVNGIVYCFN